MGIRIQKTLGYGLQNITSKDKRINWNSKLFDPETEIGDDFSQFLEGFAEKEYQTKLCLKPLETYFANECILNEANTLLITYPRYSWRHYADDIDYVEHKLSGENEETVVKQVYGGIHPYNKYCMKSTNKLINMPEQIIQDIVEFKQTDDFVQSLGLGLNSCQDFLDKTRLFIPIEIAALSVWGDLFIDEKLWKDLIPLYVKNWE